MRGNMKRSASSSEDDAQNPNKFQKEDEGNCEEDEDKVGGSEGNDIGGIGERCVLITTGISSTAIELNTRSDQNASPLSNTTWFPPVKELTVEDVFGKYSKMLKSGRPGTMAEIWREIFDAPEAADDGKYPLHYLHASPGMGKTFILVQLMEKIPGNLKPDEIVRLSDIHLLGLNFNSKFSVDSLDFWGKLPALLALAYLYYTTYADKNQFKWDIFAKSFTTLNDQEISNRLQYMWNTLVTRNKNLGGKTVLLVDEILLLKTYSDTLASGVRRVICNFMPDICSNIIFSSIDQKFIRDEKTYSRRPVLAAATLPLLTFSETLNILNLKLPQNVLFVNQSHHEGCLDRSRCIEQLAAISGGHPRSIEYIIAACKSQGEKSLEYIIQYVNKMLDIKPIYNDGEKLELSELVNLAILGKPVNLDDKIDGFKFQELVACGVLNASFHQDNTSFIPTLSELTLHKWINDKESQETTSSYDDEKRALLKRILSLRANFSGVQFEKINEQWEMFIRLFRPSEEFSRIRVSQLYVKDSSRIFKDVANCVVDAKTPLKKVQYVRGTNVVIEPYTLYYSSSKQQSGWDRLIILTAYPTDDTSGTIKYVLPIFLQYKFSEIDSTSTVCLNDVNTSHKNCKDFFDSYISLPEGYQYVPCNNKFVHVFQAFRNSNLNVKSKCEPNTLLLDRNDLKKLYGPTLSYYLDYLIVDEQVTIISPDNIESNNKHLNDEIK